MYTVVVRHTFRAPHQLEFADAIEPLHDHEWCVEVFLSSSQLDESGCVIDFRKADELLASLTEGWIKEGLGTLSTEKIAQEIHSRLDSLLKTKYNHITLGRVVVWEDKNHAGIFQ